MTYILNRFGIWCKVIVFKFYFTYFFFNFTYYEVKSIIMDIKLYGCDIYDFKEDNINQSMIKKTQVKIRKIVNTKIRLIIFAPHYLFYKKKVRKGN